VFPPELDEKQLLLYLDGEANKEILSHIERCAYCREKSETLDRLQKRLTTRLYRLTCPPTIELGEYHLRLLPASQMLVVAQHVRECPHCAREVSQLDDFLGHFTSTPEGSLLGKAKVLIARLVGGQAAPGKEGETGFAPVVPALRGEARAPLTFEVDGVIIIVDIQPTRTGTVNILGQVAADDQEQWTGALVEVRQAGELEFTANVDDLGAFRSESLFPGPKELRIRPIGGSVVIVMNFELSI
jgi:hypothetical protein